ncbi:ABC transporter substrate-binding protein [Treponema brennaborense]|uniref:Extracellular solute-binding protein family 1 n=1 Tax=Treponema brennaborense (strain DSM 12168 / CIP 105900 / DD5/3) TaxID=906968 RepID=F4LLU6_TREBD|nr:extracellular solute-binding protein [Treponema brennaborense]AEE15638.1 extracellular solute-binding protein family 1 [Treponema brennaborense DSM 12168]
MRKTMVTVCALFVCAAGLLFAGGKGDASSGKTTLKLGLWPEETLTGDIKLHEGYLQKFKETHPDIAVSPLYYKYATDTFVSLAESGQLPTVFETWFTEPQKLIDGEFVKDITAELKARGWIEKMNPSIANLLSKNGKIYGVPRDAYALGLMLNVDLFRKAGLVDANGVPKYPKTWDELAQTAKIIKDKTGAAGLCLLAKDNAGGWHFSNIAWGFGAEFEKFDKSGKCIAQLNTPEVAAAVQYVKDLKWKYDVLTPDPTNEDWGTGFRALGTGTAAMYIAAQDAVNMPTQVNGLDVNDLSIVPVPAGPKGQYSLMGGTPYMFAANATSAEINAALDYLVIMGKSPEVTDESVAGMKADAANRYNEGIPVIPPFPAWTDKALLTARDAAEKPYRNVDMALFNDYYAKTTETTNLKSEEPILAQDLYAELTKVLQAVLTDKNANVQTLLNTAQKNFQSILDTQYNK